VWVRVIPGWEIGYILIRYHECSLYGKWESESESTHSPTRSRWFGILTSGDI